MKLLTLNSKRKFYKKNYILLLFLMLILCFSIYKSYAIYKLEEKYDLLESKIGTYKNSDVMITALVDGEETNTFPTYETNYKVTSIECSNGVVGEWDTINWRLIIADMSSTSTKCTVNFDSTKTNEETPVKSSKNELFGTYKETRLNKIKILKTDFLNDIYPVGSIYITFTEDTIEKVAAKFGGTWVKYSEGTTLVGTDTSFAANSTGGTSKVSLTVSNLPNHSHGIPALNGTAATTSIKGTLRPLVWGADYVGGVFSLGSRNLDRTFNFGSYVGGATINFDGSHGHTVTTNASNTNSCINCNGSEFSIQNPYTAVYMYKRTA